MSKPIRNATTSTSLVVSWENQREMNEASTHNEINFLFYHFFLWINFLGIWIIFFLLSFDFIFTIKSRHNVSNSTTHEELKRRSKEKAEKRWRNWSETFKALRNVRQIYVLPSFKKCLRFNFFEIVKEKKLVTTPALTSVNNAFDISWWSLNLSGN